MLTQNELQTASDTIAKVRKNIDVLNNALATTLDETFYRTLENEKFRLLTVLHGCEAHIVEHFGISLYSRR